MHERRYIKERKRETRDGEGKRKKKHVQERENE
jgi:hypothetical protein